MSGIRRCKNSRRWHIFLMRENMIAGDNHIDPAKWSPLIYNFRHYQGLGKELGKTFKAEI
jgi:hypothetical protein